MAEHRAVAPVLLGTVPVCEAYETEPNHGALDGESPSDGPVHWFSPGVVLCGSFFGGESDVDVFSFNAVAGVTYRFEVLAQFFGSSADPTLEILDDEGSRADYGGDGTDGAFVNDSCGLDATIHWTAQESGEYHVVLKNLAPVEEGASDGFYRLLTSSAASDP
tara:strand:+ start:53 stop:541 length:489 start_codon:yes stop_codon:yes gene_type:complete